MEKKKVDLSGAKTFLKSAKKAIVSTIDQNGDASFDKEDVSLIAGKISTSTKKAVADLKETAEAKNLELEKKRLQPIFEEDINSADFLLSKIVCVTEMDKKRAESSVCKGSIGYVSEQKGLNVVCIFRNQIDKFGLSFYPDQTSEIYYIDPSDKDRYIALDEYFGYMKVARVNELQKIAQDLGAKHFRITYKEQKTSFSKSTADVNSKLQTPTDNGSVSAERDLASSAVSSVEIAAESDFPGHEPTKPKLFYLQRDPSIQSLVALRMDSSSPLSHQKLTLKLSNSSGIKERDAIKIDAALKSMKYVGNATVFGEVKNESRRFLEYEIDF